MAASSLYEVMATRISSPFVFRTPEAMQTWAGRLAKILKPGDVVALIGGLGAGKTTFVQGIARAWGTREPASSPTFALANEYRTSHGVIYHMDMYRLSPKELAAFPIDEYWGGDALCLVEWADRVQSRWPQDTLAITLRSPSANTREAQFLKLSRTWERRLSKFHAG